MNNLNAVIKNEKSKYLKFLYEPVISFAVSLIILIIAFAMNGIYPGSDKSIFIYDMQAQYAAFFSYLYHLGEGYNSLMYQTLSGFGGGYFAVWAYYTSSPLSWLVLLFDPGKLPDTIYYLTVFKISLCATSFSIYLKIGKHKCNDTLVTIIASVSYALMSYNMVYSMSVMWLDGVIMLPMVILGLERIIEGKSRCFFIIALAISIISNYYTAYMIVLYVVIHYIYLGVCSEIKFRKYVKVGISLFISGIISVLISAWIWLPVLLDLARGRLSEDIKKYSGIIRSPLSVLRQFLPISYGGFMSNGNPPIYCGMIVTVLLILFFFGRKSGIKKKIAVAMVLVLFIVSFCWDRADMLWHGMQIPNLFPTRYSFVVGFFIISISVESTDEYITKFDSKIKIIRALEMAALSLMVLDLSYNAFYSIRSLEMDTLTGDYIERMYYDYYYYMLEDASQYIDLSDKHIVSDVDYSANDGLMFGVPSIDYFSSSYNLNLSLFCRSIGLNAVHHNIEDKGLCPLSASLLGIDHYAEFFPEYVSSNNISKNIEFYEPENCSTIPVLYSNIYSASAGYCINESDEFSYNAFENLNIFNKDVTGVDKVFVPCRLDLLNTEELFLEGKKIYRRNYIVHPAPGEHIYFYVSPEDYMLNGDGLCYDALYLGEALIASYENIGDRYIVDLGLSDGTPLNFTFDHESMQSEVWFYSFDDVAYADSMCILKNNSVQDVLYSDEGIVLKTSFDNEEDVLILLPYEDGYEISIDGIISDCSSYKNAFLKIHCPSGNHQIYIKYFTPGLKCGLELSAFGVIMLIILMAFELKLHLSSSKRQTQYT